jgi:ABC-2 type transport system permease protein
MGAVGLVAMREFTERLRSRAFLISNGVVMGLLLLSVSLPLLMGENDPTKVGYVGDDGARVASVAATQQDNFAIEIETTEVADRPAAEAAIDAGDLDAVLLDAGTVLVDRTIDTRLEALLANASNALRVDDRLADAGLSEEERQELFAIGPLEVTSRTEDGNAIDPFSPPVMVAFFGVFLLYGLLVIYGQWVAQGIVEEKQSRVIEVLLSTVRPVELLGGKILGLGMLGFAQILLIAAIGVGGLSMSDTIELPSSGYGALALVVVWFIPGYLLYATLFAMSGAVVSRVEDLQSAVMPVIIVLVLALFGAQIAISDPTSTMATVAGVFPFTAPIVQPVLVASGAIGVWEMILAAVLAVLALAIMLPICARIYRGGILATRTKTSYRAAWTNG